MTFTALFQNHVEWIFPAFFGWQHLYASWWFSWNMLSDMKSLPENFSWHRSSDLFGDFSVVNKYFLFKFPAFKFHNDQFFFQLFYHQIIMYSIRAGRTWSLSTAKTISEHHLFAKCEHGLKYILQNYVNKNVRKIDKWKSKNNNKITIIMKKHHEKPKQLLIKSKVSYNFPMKETQNSIKLMRCITFNFIRRYSYIPVFQVAIVVLGRVATTKPLLHLVKLNWN